jgi:uncharacterized protein (DUF488 family)
MQIHTIGHSTRSLDQFLQLLQQNSIESLADVRTIPRSRFNPQFNREAIHAFLKEKAIHYSHHPDLGGLRKPQSDSPNIGWKNKGFRGYADYMQTEKFERAVAELIDLAKKQRVAMMCAEAVYWRCHRMLLSDALLVRGVSVFHILDHGRTEPHKLTSFAHVEGTHILYLPEEPYQPPLL